MGNTFVCPVGFTPAGPLQCAVTCPADKGLENRMSGSEARCVYTQDTTKFIALKLASMLSVPNPQAPPPTLDWVRTNAPAVYPAYKAAQDDFTAKSATLLASIDKDKRILDAFKGLQEAENVRDAAPQAYQDARIRYYTLTKGDGWVADERKRVLNAEVLPTIVPYVQSINTITERQAQQASTRSAVDAVKSKLISLKDDFRITTTTLTKQVNELKNQIELEKRRATVQQQATSEWFLNVILVLLSLALIFVLVRRLWRPASVTSAPAYTSLPGR